MTSIAPPAQLLRAVGLARIFGTGSAQVAAVEGVNLDFDPATVTAIMGPSGSGKSTLMHLLAGLDRPTAGQVTLGALDVTRLADDELTALRRTAMGFVFQSFNLFDELTAAENIDLPFTLGENDRAIDARWRAQLLDELDLTALQLRYPTELSGGQQQRVAIARALVHKPAVVFADEPTGNLDLATGRSVLALLSSLAPVQGCTVIMVTHDPVAASAADRVLILADGRIVHDLPRTDPAELSRIALGRLAR